MDFFFSLINFPLAAVSRSFSRVGIDESAIGIGLSLAPTETNGKIC